MDTAEIRIQGKTAEKRELSMSLQIYPGYLD
jgi:hypothetical protein